MNLNYCCKNPLIIASSGGNGHISAAKNIICELEQKNQFSLAYHEWQKPSKSFFSFEGLVRLGLRIAYKQPLKWVLETSFHMMLPNPKDIEQEYQLLYQTQAQNPKRQYVDFILDLLPSGYLFTAIFNVMQRIGHPKTLERIVTKQSFLDFFYKRSIKRQIKDLLEQAIRDKKAFDVIISTQAMGLAGIFAAVEDYNRMRTQYQNIYQCELPILEIHEFITDIPHISAIHFLEPLKKLSPSQKQLMNLHLLDINPYSQFTTQIQAKQIFLYKPNENPMIRQDFKYEHQQPSYGIHSLHSQNYIITLTPKQRLAVILLSSANGQTSLEYIDALERLRIEHIALVGHPSEQIKQALNHHDPKSIHLLGQLNSQEISQILMHAHILIIKGGGLSLMEISAFELAKESYIFIHKPIDETTQEPSSGLIWEDGNTHWFMSHCAQKKQKAFISQPQSMIKQYRQHQKFI